MNQSEDIEEQRRQALRDTFFSNAKIGCHLMYYSPTGMCLAGTYAWRVNNKENSRIGFRDVTGHNMEVDASDVSILAEDPLNVKVTKCSEWTSEEMKEHFRNCGIK